MSELHRPHEEVERINRQAIEAVKEASAKLCQKMIDVSYEIVKVHLQADKEHHEAVAEAGYQPGDQLGFFTQRDKFTATRQDDKPVQTYSIRLEPEDAKRNGHNLRLFVPAVGVDIGKYEMPDKEAVTRMYAELHEDGDTHWYIVHQDGMDEYMPALRQEEGMSFLNDQGIWEWLNERIPESHTTIDKLSRKIINWTVVPQRLDSVPDWPNKSDE